MRSLLLTVLIFVCVISSIPASFARLRFQLVEELTGRGGGDPEYGDLFGSTACYNPAGSTVMIGAPDGSTSLLPDDGAVYFFQAQREQIFRGIGSFDSLSSTKAASRGDWSFVPDYGTPLDAAITAKDFSGALQVYQYQPRHGWVNTQTIYNPLGASQCPACFFGANIAYDGGEYLVVGAFFATMAWFYKLDSRLNPPQWYLAQTVDIPAPYGPGYIFPAISGTHTLISVPSAIQAPTNGQVVAFELIGGTWTLVQTISGYNNPITAYNVGDFFGEFLSISGNHAVITAPLDSQIDGAAGAVYFAKFSNGQWDLTQKVFSDRPSALFGFGAAIQGDLAVISDSGRTVGNNLFQGAGIVYQQYASGLWEPVPNSLLIDPNGRAFDFLGSGGIDFNLDVIVLGSSRYNVNYIPPTFPNLEVPPQPVLPGRAVVYIAEEEP